MLPIRDFCPHLHPVRCAGLAGRPHASYRGHLASHPSSPAVFCWALPRTIILVLHFREKRRDAATKNIAGGSDMDTLLRDAEKRLAAAQRTGAKSLDSLPLLYLVGEGNSAKTTSILKSGLDPELLAGQIYRDQDVIATPVVNLWYTQQCVIVEAGSAVRNSPALWSKLIRKTRPKAYRSAMGTQAPVRAAVVCISCELFLGAACVGSGAGRSPFHQPDAPRSRPASGNGSSGLRDPHEARSGSRTSANMFAI